MWTMQKLHRRYKEYTGRAQRRVPLFIFCRFVRHGFPSQSLNSSRVMTSRSHFFFISRACSLQA